MGVFGVVKRGARPRARGCETTRQDRREKLEAALNELFGRSRAPVPSLYPKLAGRADTSVKDACRIVAALLISWPEPLSVCEGAKSREERRRTALELAESFSRELLSDLSNRRSYEWTAQDMEIRVFRLVDEERVRVSQFIKDAGEKQGALIVAGARNILVGPNPVAIIQQFHELTSEFIGEKHQGILIFVI